ncbi:hypothetical protein BGZ49_004380, partial [Haplosporangium sp. Z 27]
MSSVRNRCHHPALPMGREHCVRVRRMMGRSKHQLHRREQFSATASDMYHKASNRDMSWTMSSRSTSHNNTVTTGTTSIQRRQRRNLTADHGCFFNDRISENGYDGDVYSLSVSTISSSASPFFLGCGSNYHREALENPLLLPLPPVVQRIDLAGSPFSPFSPSNSYESIDCNLVHRGNLRPGNLYGGGARAHSSGGGGSGGGGGDGGPTPDGLSPGGGDATDGDQPSEYTFRRRNAIVE